MDHPIQDSAESILDAFHRYKKGIPPHLVSTVVVEGKDIRGKVREQGGKGVDTGGQDDYRGNNEEKGGLEVYYVDQEKVRSRKEQNGVYGVDNGSKEDIRGTKANTENKGMGSEHIGSQEVGAVGKEDESGGKKGDTVGNEDTAGIEEGTVGQEEDNGVQEEGTEDPKEQKNNKIFTGENEINNEKCFI